MMYVGTTEAARQIGVSPRTLRRWLQKRLIGEPRAVSINTVGGRRGTMKIRMFASDEVEALKRFAARYRAEVKARRRRPRNYKLPLEVKAARAAMRKEINNAEKLLHVAEWFATEGHSLRNHTIWEHNYAFLDRAGLLDAEHKLLAGTIELLREKVAKLRAEYAAMVAGPLSTPAEPRSLEERRLDISLGWGRGSASRGGTR